MMKSSISGVSDLKAALGKIADGFDQPTVTVGIHEDAAPPEGELNMATLGAVHEFGTKKTPQREWLRPGVATGEKEYAGIVSASLVDNPDGSGLDQALNQIGVVAVGMAQQFMTELSTPANAESTIKSKGSSNPLIDTGALRQSITYKLQENVEEGL
jgi:hypothetical protein